MKKQQGHNLDLIPKLALADQLETPLPKIKKSPSRSSARKTEEPKDGKQRKMSLKTDLKKFMFSKKADFLSDQKEIYSINRPDRD